MPKIFVIKLGGSVLKDASSVRQAANSVRKLFDDGHRVVIVASALKGVTDALLQSSNTVSEEVPPWVLTNLISMGERSSAQLIATVFSGLGFDPKIYDPDSEEWPIVTDETFFDAEPDLEVTGRLIARSLPSALESGKLPIICGFLGKSTSGRITLLGRGGSDTTAVLLGRFLRADAVLLVKDVGGFMTADPRSSDTASHLQRLSADEAYALSSGGAKVIQSKALRYKNRDLIIRIVSLDSPLDHGTVIEGELTSLDVSISYSTAAMITSIVDDEGDPVNVQAELLKKAYETKTKVISSVSEGRAILVYLQDSEDAIREFYEETTKLRGVKGASVFRGLSQIVVRGAGLETKHGVILDIVRPLTEGGINVYGITTISSSVRIYVRSEEARKALNIVRSSSRLKA